MAASYGKASQQLVGGSTLRIACGHYRRSWNWIACQAARAWFAEFCRSHVGL